METFLLFLLWIGGVFTGFGIGLWYSHRQHEQLRRDAFLLIESAKNFRQKMLEFSERSQAWFNESEQKLERFRQSASYMPPDIGADFLMEVQMAIEEGRKLQASRPHLKVVYSKEKDT